MTVTAAKKNSRYKCGHKGVRWRQCYTDEEFALVDEIVRLSETRDRAHAIRQAIEMEYRRQNGDAEGASYRGRSQSFYDRVVDRTLPEASEKSDSKGKAWTFWLDPTIKNHILEIRDHRDFNRICYAVRFALRAEYCMLKGEFWKGKL